LFDGSTGERIPSDGQVRLIDATDKGGHYYVLLAASAPPNCNVQGQCGASSRPDTTVIWLKLASDLSIEETRNFVVEDCRAGRSVEQEPDDWADRVRLIDGKLVLVFREYGQGRNGADVTGRLEYERSAPERGIQVSRPAPGGS
jgi:hypothetical protein